MTRSHGWNACWVSIWHQLGIFILKNKKESLLFFILKKSKEGGHDKKKEREKPWIVDKGSERMATASPRPRRRRRRLVSHLHVEEYSDTTQVLCTRPSLSCLGHKWWISALSCCCCCYCHKVSPFDTFPPLPSPAAAFYVFVSPTDVSSAAATTTKGTERRRGCNSLVAMINRWPSTDDMTLPTPRLLPEYYS